MITRGRRRHDTLRDQIADAVKHMLGQNGYRHGNKETFWALKNVSFEVEAGEVIGLVGQNGAGKSTLLKILSRITAPTNGVVDIHGRVGSLLEVGTGFHHELSGRENIYLNGAILGMKKSEIDRKFDEIVAFSEIEKFIDTPVKHYSSGMYVRLAFAVAAHLEPEVLLVDEVLAVGDAAFQKKCLGKMEGVAKEGRTVLFVSHNMAAVEHLCNKVFLVQNGEITFSGNAKEGIDRYFVSVAGEAEGSDGKPVDLTLASGRPKQVRSLLKRLELFNGDGKPLCGNIQIGGTLNARVSFRLENPSAAFDIILGIDNHLGQRVFTASSEFQPGRSEQVRRDDQTMICEIPNLLLVPGEYKIKVVLNLNGRAADWVENATRIKVVESDYYKSGKVPRTGLIVLDQHWSLEPNRLS